MFSPRLVEFLRRYPALKYDLRGAKCGLETFLRTATTILPGRIHLQRHGLTVEWTFCVFFCLVFFFCVCYALNSELRTSFPPRAVTLTSEFRSQLGEDRGRMDAVLLRLVENSDEEEQVG